MSQFPIEDALKPECDALRAALGAIEERVRALAEANKQPRRGDPAADARASERIAQSMLALRHVEDARMRIGKVLQYARDGVSVFDAAAEARKAAGLAP